MVTGVLNFMLLIDYEYTLASYDFTSKMFIKHLTNTGHLQYLLK